MSPNADATFGLILAGAIMVAGILCIGFASKFKDVRAFFLGLAVMTIGFAIGFPIIALNEFATGRAKYELHDNPDGTRTWRRVEVTK